jgi:transcriptional regulator with XRE-family HTH domain
MAAGITQEALADAAKLTPKFVSQIENDHVNPSIGVLTRLVEDGLGVSLAAFFADDGEGEVSDDLARLGSLLASQPPSARRIALRLLQVLFANDGSNDQ